MKETHPIQSVGILVFDDIELLDFAGPLQLFSGLRCLYPELLPKVEVVGMSSQITVSKSGITVGCNRQVDESDGYDLFIIPGGQGTRPIIKDETSLTQIHELIKKSEKIASVCTGSLILAQLGLLKNKEATTHHKAFDLLQSIDPSVQINPTARYIDHEDIIIAQGVSAGIDMSFYLISKYFGKSVSDDVRKYIEYFPEDYNL